MSHISIAARTCTASRALALGAVVLTSASAAASAAAQEHPVFLPTRDVAVTYQLTGGPGGQAQTTHLYFSAATGRLRIDTPNNAGYTLLDRTNKQRLMVMNDQQSYVAIPLDPGTEDGFILNSTMRYQRQGSDTVRGIPCTVWSVSSDQATGSACVTEDGVLLRGLSHQTAGQSAGQDTGLVATAVDYAPQAASLFEPPPGYRKLDPAQIQDQQGGPGGPGGEPGGEPGGPPQAGPPSAGPSPAGPDTGNGQ